MTAANATAPRNGSVGNPVANGRALRQLPERVLTLFVEGEVGDAGRIRGL